MFDIAGLKIRMDCKDGMLYERSRAYLSKNQDGKEDFTVAMPDEILKQKAEALPQLTADECYYVYMGEAFYYNLLNHNGVLLHASCIEKTALRICFPQKAASENPLTRIYGWTNSPTHIW